MNQRISTTYDLMLFDLDGTLVETAPEIGDAVNDTLQHFMLPMVSQQQVANWIGHGTRELLIQALACVNHTTDTLIRTSSTLPTISAEFDHHYGRRCGTRSHLYPHVREVLTQLRAKGTRLAVVTNKESRYTQLVLDAHQLAPMFDRIVCGDTLATKKPNPAGVQSCLAEFAVPPERALFIGDSSIDVATARNAGVAVWALPYGYNMGAPIADCQPDRVIGDFRALLPTAMA